MNTELRVINEGTAELQLPHSCPTCAGPLELRISADGVRSFCATCRSIGRPRLQQSEMGTFVLDFKDIGRA
ncbi:MAG: hypothetical protein Q8L48_07530 [Archangium sp.]|nr:hypothetical protein [Archangium sp.]